MSILEPTYSRWTQLYVSHPKCIVKSRRVAGEVIDDTLSCQQRHNGDRTYINKNPISKWFRRPASRSSINIRGKKGSTIICRRVEAKALLKKKRGEVIGAIHGSCNTPLYLADHFYHERSAKVDGI